MASCTCHVLCGTKRLRLERIVRPHRLILALKASQPSLIVFSWRQKARCARAREINCRCLWYVFRELQQLLAYAYSMNLEFISKLGARSEEHTSELQSLMRISYAVFCLKKKNQSNINNKNKTI